MKKARLLAYYLPQYHPIPENNKWWGNGFTEWTNVVKAKPLFPGHWQPRLPADLGIYDLRVPETRLAQAEMAREHGIEGFMYWHYWFAGKRLLERPFNEVLRSGEPDFPFCLAWANESWSGIWYGAPDNVLVKQTYPGLKDYEDHFYAILDALTDERYLTVEEKPLVFILRPHKLPDPVQFTECWRELAHKEGLNGLYFIGLDNPIWRNWDAATAGFDGVALTNLMHAFMFDDVSNRYLDSVSKRITGLLFKPLKRQLWSRPHRLPYEKTLEYAIKYLAKDEQQYPELVPNWDNTPRSGPRGRVMENSTPELFRRHLRQVLSLVSDRPLDKRLIFVKSWNEWAEGNYLEPDTRYGKAHLEVIKDEIT